MPCLALEKKRNDSNAFLLLQPWQEFKRLRIISTMKWLASSRLICGWKDIFESFFSFILQNNTVKLDFEYFVHLFEEYYLSDDPSDLGNFINGRLRFEDDVAPAQGGDDEDVDPGLLDHRSGQLIHIFPLWMPLPMENNFSLNFPSATCFQWRNFWRAESGLPGSLSLLHHCFFLSIN